jgi:hypothetical protein
MSDKWFGEDDPPVSVYRVVDEPELSYLETYGNYGSNPSQSGKYFALTLDGARAFANAPMNVGSTLTTATLPQSVANRGVRFNDPGRYGAGSSIFFSQRQLGEVYGTISRPVIWKER